MDIIKPIADPVSFDSLKEELESTLHLGNCNDLDIYIFKGGEAPLAMREVGRLREISFRQAGGGTGENVDIDPWDDSIFRQIICVDNESREITGGYRFFLCNKLSDKEDGKRGAVEELFYLTPEFVDRIFIRSVELGRSFVHADSKQAKKTLDALWGGLCALTTEPRPFDYFLGKVTFYPKQLKPLALDTLLYFLNKQFPGDSKVIPREGMEYTISASDQEIEKTGDISFDWSQGYEYNRKILFLKFASLKQELRPFMLLFKYIDLTPSEGIATYGGAWNSHFGNVVEIMLVIDIRHINEAMFAHYITPCNFIDKPLFEE